jgi:hypothetical protein
MNDLQENPGRPGKSKAKLGNVSKGLMRTSTLVYAQLRCTEQLITGARPRYVLIITKASVIVLYRFI